MSAPAMRLVEGATEIEARVALGDASEAADDDGRQPQRDGRVADDQRCREDAMLGVVGDSCIAGVAADECYLVAGKPTAEHDDAERANDADENSCQSQQLLEFVRPGVILQQGLDCPEGDVEREHCQACAHCVRQPLHDRSHFFLSVEERLQDILEKPYNKHILT